MANSYYFTHDYNSRTDPKVKKLLLKHGMAGYGIFWAIVEDLYNNANALPTDYESIAFELRTDVLVIQSIVSDFGLFVIDGETFSSSAVQKRIEEREQKSEKAKKSALKRWSKDANALPPQSDSNAIKGNEIKGNSKYTLEYFEQQGYEFNLPKIGHDAINRFLEWREKHPSHGAIKSPQQVEAIIIGFRNKNYTAEQVVASVNKTIANGAKNLIMDEVVLKPKAKTTIPKPHPDLPEDWWTSTTLTKEQILLIPSSINAARITAQNRAKGHNLGI